MKRNVVSFMVPAVVVTLVACLAGQSPAPGLEKVTLPPGFTIEEFATGVRNARSLARGAKGTIFVGTHAAGNVYALIDTNGDQKADRTVTIASGLNMPNGVAFRDGALYVAEVNRVLRYDGIEDALDKVPAPVVVNASLPSDRHHGWKFIAFGPDGLLYVPVGAPCNICDRSDSNEQYATILRMKPDGTGTEVFARGVRNTVGFDWHPAIEAGLWFTDNGRDWLGDDQPGDELNHAPTAGLHFGFPYCHAGTISGSGIRREASLLGVDGAGAGRSARTWRRSGCASTPARCSPRPIAAGSSSPNTGAGIDRLRRAIA